ncbi:hypothetical protein GGR53DRAFT_374999 [Hypoxylon sp. FL1150]|nr:hypothetical protein GGR53DRAFT_374999 [Hypoxylon sp. FL1150]
MPSSEPEPELTATEALDRAQARIRHVTTSEKLSREVVNEILSYCDVPSTINLALTGPIFYNFVMGDEHHIAGRLMTSAIGTYLMPLAVARYLAKDIYTERAKRRLEELLNPLPQAIMSFVDKIRPDMERYKRLVVEKYNPTHVKFTLKMAYESLAFHSCVTYHSRQLQVQTQHRSAEPGFNYPTDEEKQRFEKAVYIHQLSCDLFPAGVRPTDCYTGDPGPLESACAKFFRMFAPWEHHQVRCVHQLLVKRIETAIYEETGEDEASKSHPLDWFVVQKGVEAFQTYECEGGPALVRAAERFERHFSDPDKYRRHSWYSRNDLLWLKLRSDGKNISFNVDHIFAEFPENDSGPRDIWFFTLLVSFSDNQLLWPAEFPDDIQSLSEFAWLTEDGWWFWGREKLDRYTGGSLPTPRALREVSRTVETTSVDRYRREVLTGFLDELLEPEVAR